MDSIKVEVDEDDYLSRDNSCFICVQSVTRTNQEKSNSLNFVINYLKIRGRIKSVVCDKCEEILAKFSTLCKILEKVRLEMDYLLGFIHSAILKSIKDAQPASLELISYRESVMKKCQEKILYPKPEIILQRIDKSIKKNRSQIADNQMQQAKRDGGSGSRLNFLEQSYESESAATPIVSDLQIIKLEPNLKNDSDIDDGKGKRSASNERTRCRKCRKTFNRRHLKFHDETVHLGLKPFKCSTCSKSFTRSCDLRAHINVVHLRHKPHKCDLCDKSFGYLSVLKLHRKRHNTTHNSKPKLPNPQFNCHICEKSFKNKKSLRNHSYSHSLGKRHACDICKMKFQDLYALKRHISSVHDKQRYECQVIDCNKSYSRTLMLHRHYKLDHPGFIVEKTRKSPDYSKTLDNGKSIFECKLCNSKFITVNSVGSHLRAVHGPKSFKCQDCSYATTIKGNLERHVEHNHKTGNNECKICKKQFKSVFLVGLHMRVHGPKNFRCDNCGFATAFKSNLKKHVKRVHEDRQG